MADIQTAFLTSMAIVIAVAAVIVILFHRFRQPLILGYLIAGMLVGLVVTDIQITLPDGTVLEDVTIRDIIELLARLGIILLTFSIGLEFSFKQLRRIGIAVIMAATIEIAVMIGVGYQLGRALGYTSLESSLLGAILSVASTMIIIRALRETGGLDNEKSRLIVGLLVVEDFAAVLILAGVSGLVTSGEVNPSDLFWLVTKMLVFVGASVFIGIAAVPRLVDYIGRQRSNELLVLSILGLCFSMAIFARWVGFSEAIGAFVMGVIVSESRYLGDVVRRIEPVRDLFGAIFFITIGMLVDLTLLDETAFILGAAVIILVFVMSKMLACTVATFICGFGARNSFGAGLSMIAIGEFSLMIAAVAIGAEGIREEIYPTIVVVTTVTALIVPYSVKYASRATDGLAKHAPKSILVLASYLNLVIRNMRRRSGSSSRLSNEMRNSITRLFVYLIAMTSVILVAFNIVSRADEYADILWGRSDLVMLVMVTFALVVVVFSLAGIWSRTVRIVEIATSEAMLSTKSAENIGYQATATSLKLALLGFYVILGLIIVSPLVNSLIEENVVFALTTACIIVIAIFTLYVSASTIDKKLSEILEGSDAVLPTESGDLTEIEDIIDAMERDRV